MHLKRVILIGLISLPGLIEYGQDSLSVAPGNDVAKRTELYGFVRGGLYTGFNSKDNYRPYVSSAFSDLGLKFRMENGLNYKTFADLRLRYGSEFQKPVNSFDIREGYVRVYGKRWDLSAGKQIIKWGRADFTNPTSKLNPQNYISRSPDREDMDMGNLLSAFHWYPSQKIDLEAVVVPYYRSSVLLIDPIPLPDYVKLNQINNLITDKKMLSYGLKADMHWNGIDWGLSWFDGYDPMPGAAFTSFTADLSGPVPVIETQLTMTPYKIRMAGVDFELAAGDFGIRGEAAWSIPYLSNKTYEYVPFEEIRWVAGFDWSSGIWRITGEYSGKTIPGFTPSSVDPVIGTEPDLAKLAELFSTPGADPEKYIRQQVEAFNRLYNYQLKRYYHSVSAKVDAELMYGKLAPSVFTTYNMTSRDLLVIPEIKFKPSDGLTITAGAELYSGSRGSLFDLVNGFMNSVYVALKVDF